MPRNTLTKQIYHITIRNLGIASGPVFFFFFKSTGGHGRRKILMDSHPYSHETAIFTLGAPHEEVRGWQTKLHPGFSMGKLMQPSPGISILRDSHIFHFLNFLHKFKKLQLRKKIYQKGPQHACSTYLFKHLLQQLCN